MAKPAHHMQPKRLTSQQEATIRAAWAAGASRDEVARAAGVSVDILVARLADQLADLPRRGRGGSWRAPTPDPTPLEIAAAAAELRSRWAAERWLPEPLAPEDDIGATARPTRFTIR